MNKDINEILSLVCDFFKIEPSVLLGYSRKTDIKRARHYFYYLCKMYTKLTLAKIGSIAVDYGRKESYSHSSIIHSVKEINNITSVDKHENSILNSLLSLIDYKHVDLIIKDVNLLNQCIKNNKQQLNYGINR